jgi:hypothetical protein
MRDWPRQQLVVVASEGNVFRAHDVEVGPDVEGQVRVVKGLAPGEKIVALDASFMQREIESQ